MADEITDEILDIALAASDKTRRHLDPSGRMRMRAALAAALPLIRGAVVEECAKVADGRDLSIMSSTTADVTARERECSKQEALETRLGL